MQRSLLAALALLTIGTAHGQSSLPAALERLVALRNIDRDGIAVVVAPAAGGEPIIAYNTDRPLNPASTIKVVTTWAALKELGPAYRWNTDVFAMGDVRDATLEGDLLFKGNGDPYLVAEDFWKLLGALRRAGLKEIKGDLLYDDSVFAVPVEDPGAFDGQPYRSYNVAPSALLANFKSVQFEFFAGADGARVELNPPLAGVTVRNRLKLVNGRCRGFQRGIAFSVLDPQAVDRVLFEGNFPRACAPYSFSRSVLRHETYFHGLFTALWEQQGGIFRGQVLKDLAPEDAEPILRWPSRPLGEVIRSINKYSNNVMTRQLLYTLAVERFGEPGTPDNGRAAIAAILAEQGLDTDSLVVDNGAGLSRRTRISAALMADILRSAYRHHHRAEFVASLALVGLDGTARRSLRRSSRAGRMHVKTGRIDDVAALAGFVHSAAGETYLVVLLVNHTGAHRGPGRELQEALMKFAHDLEPTVAAT